MSRIRRMGVGPMHLTLGNGLILAAVALVALAAAFDWRTGFIPNWVTLGLLPIAPVIHAFGTRGTHGPFGIPGPLFAAMTSIAGALLCAVVPYVMFRLSWMGGADVKLLATVGALLTPHYGLEVELSALLLASVFVPARLAFRGLLLRTSLALAAVVARVPLHAARRRELPALPHAALESLRFSPFVFLGTAAVFLLSSFAPGLGR